MYDFPTDMNNNSPGGGGIFRFGLGEGVPLEPWNAYPFLRVIFAEEGIVPILGIFLEI